MRGCRPHLMSPRERPMAFGLFRKRPPEPAAPAPSLRANGPAPPGRANARPMTGSAPPDDRLREAIQRLNRAITGLFRRFALRFDERSCTRRAITQPPVSIRSEGLIGQSNSILQRGACAPAQFGKTADIQQFARRAVRPRGAEADLAGVSAGRGDHAWDFGNRGAFS